MAKTHTPTAGQQPRVDAGDTESRSVGVCVPVLARTHALARLLESVPEWVDEVVVADTGSPADRRRLYTDAWAFDLTVVDPGFDAGIGTSRRAALDALAPASEYVVVMDCDMEIPEGMETLIDILEARPDLGGVSGMLEEPDGRRLGACHFRERTSVYGSRQLVQEFDRSATMEPVPEVPLTPRIIRCDKLPQAGVFRRAALDDYAWDPEMLEMEHLDFFVGHHRTADWEWAACPDVLVPHHSGEAAASEDAYRDELRQRPERKERDTRRLQDKWGIDVVVLGDTRWQHYGGLSRLERVAALVERRLPVDVWQPAKLAARKVIR